MDAPVLEADYVIMGAGTTGLAFADTLLSDSTSTMILVDRRAKPGGHWLDAYPFVRLHGPSAIYGVDSMPLGSGAIDRVGLNQGLHEMASGAEICAYYDRLMQQRLLPSGRVVFLARHALDAQGVATSLVSGRRQPLRARRKWVDATIIDSQVPATHGPDFPVAPGVRWVAPSALVQLPAPAEGHVIVGGGKTAIDTALWLLEQGADPERITWIRPREAWLLNRANVQPTGAFVDRTVAAIAGELEAARDAASVPDMFARLEAARLLLRIDPAVTPTMYRCATVSEAELAQLRRIRRVVRLGHVRAIERERIVLEHGEIPTSPSQVHVHCAAISLQRGPVQPVFQGARIVPQYVRRCAPSFSAALIAHLEAALDDDAQKNRLCQPIPVPEVPLDWLRMHLLTASNQYRWLQQPGLKDWMRRSRLEAYTALFEQAATRADTPWAALQQRLQQVRTSGLQRMEELLAQEARGEAMAA